MESPQKRLRLDPSLLSTDDEDEHQDELSMTQAQFDVTQDPLYELDKGRAKAATRLKSAFEGIFEKYGKDFTGADDVINFYTDEIEVDNGHVQSLEFRKAGEEDSASSDEESRILNGKSRSQGKKSRSKSLMLANHAKSQQAPQFASPWNDFPLMDPYGLSTQAFSPFHNGPNPPFNFGGALFGNGPVDPVWNVPELPVQQPIYQNRGYTGFGRNQPGYCIRPYDQFVKRRVNAKSFLLRSASFKQSDDETADDEGEDDEDDEEDDILLGRNSGQRTFESRSRSANNRLITYSSTTSSNNLHQSSRRSKASGKKQQNNPDDHGKNAVRTRPTKALMGSLHTIPQQPTEHEAAGRSIRPIRTCRKEAQAEQQQTDSGSVATPNQESKGGSQETPARKWRIEVIIPIRRHRPPTEAGPTAEKPVVEQRNIARKQNVEPSPPDDVRNEKLEHNHEGDLVAPQSSDLVDTSRSTQANNGATIRKDLILYLEPRPPKRKWEQTEKCNVVTRSRDENKPEAKSDEASQESEPSQRRLEQTEKYSVVTRSRGENKPGASSEQASQESEPSQTIVDNSSSAIVLRRSAKPKQKSFGYDKFEQSFCSQRFSPFSFPRAGQNEVAHNICPGDVAVPVAVDTSNSEEELLQPSLSSEEGHMVTDYDSDEQNAAIRVAEIISASIMQQGLTGSRNGDGLPLRLESNPPLTILNDEMRSVQTDLPDETTHLQHDLKLADVAGSRETPDTFEDQIIIPERFGRGPSPELSSFCENTELEGYTRQRSLSSTLKASTPDQEHSAFEFDNPRSDLGHLNFERSTSPETTEAVSNHPSKPPAFVTSGLAIRLLSPPTEPDTQINENTRHASPELGLPNGPEIIRGLISQDERCSSPETPTEQREPKDTKSTAVRHCDLRTRRHTLTSLIPGGIDDESDEELSLRELFSRATTRWSSSFSHAKPNDGPDLPPLLSTPRKRHHKHGHQAVTLSSSAKTPKRKHKSHRHRDKVPATDSRAGRRQNRHQERSRAVHSSPLARKIADRLLSSPTKGLRARRPTSPESPRQCGKNGFVCERAFCLTCCL